MQKNTAQGIERIKIIVLTALSACLLSLVLFATPAPAHAAGLIPWNEALGINMERFIDNATAHQSTYLGTPYSQADRMKGPGKNGAMDCSAFWSFLVLREGGISETTMNMKMGWWMHWTGSLVKWVKENNVKYEICKVKDIRSGKVRLGKGDFIIYQNSSNWDDINAMLGSASHVAFYWGLAPRGGLTGDVDQTVWHSTTSKGNVMEYGVLSFYTDAFVVHASSAADPYKEPYKTNSPYQRVAWERIQGSSALATMQSIVKKGWSASSFTAAQRPATAVVATRGSFPDALAASSLAGAYGAPVLMTNPQVLSGETKSELTRLKIKRVFIVGGPLALSSGVEKAIKQLGIKVERVAGTKSSSTAVAIAKKLPNPSKTCIVATRANYKDALSASPYAYAKQVPIFLVEDRGKTITQETLNAIKTGGFTSILIVGGTSAVSDGVEKKLKSMKATVKRIGGRTAVDTSIELAKWQLNNGMSLNKGAIATSNNFPDALAGAALCGKNKAVLILSSKGGVSKVAKVFQPLCKQTGAKTVYVFGGTFAVSDKEYRSLFNSSLLERATALSLDGYYYYGSVYSASPSSAQALRT